MIIGHFIKSVRIKKTLADLLSPDLEKSLSVTVIHQSRRKVLRPVFRN